MGEKVAEPPFGYVLGYPHHCQLCGEYMGEAWSMFFRICEDCEVKLAEQDQEDNVDVVYEFR